MKQRGVCDRLKEIPLQNVENHVQECIKSTNSKHNIHEHTILLFVMEQEKGTVDRNYFFLNEMNKKVLPAIYSTAFWCLFVVLLVFWLFCVTTVTPFIEQSEGWSLRSVGVLDQSQQKYHFFFAEIQICCKFFSSSPRKKPLLPLREICPKKNP